jgi:hypothetical protein
VEYRGLQAFRNRLRSLQPIVTRHILSVQLNYKLARSRIHESEELADGEVSSSENCGQSEASNGG